MARPLPGLRRLGLVRRGDGGQPPPGAGPQASTGRTGPAAQPPAPSACPTSSRRPPSASAAASPSSTSCSAAASCRARWCSSAASPASASPRCCCRCSTRWPRRAARSLLVCGEESAAQVKMRAERICDDPGAITVLAETELETVLEASGRPAPGAGRRRLGADALQRRLHLGAGQRQPGARGGRAASCASPRRPARPSSSSVT